MISFLKKKNEISWSVSVTILGHAVPVHWVLLGLSSPLLPSSFDLGRDCLV